MHAYLVYVKLPSDIDLAYIAGFIDGEGTLSISKGGKKSHHTSPVVSICNTNLDILKWIQLCTNGGSIYNAHKRQNPKWKPAYNLQYNSTDGKILVIKLLPYLKIKIKQAFLLIEYWEELKKPPNSQSRRDNTAKLKDKIQLLNKRGRSYAEAIDKVGVELEENTEHFDICDITGTGHCGT